MLLQGSAAQQLAEQLFMAELWRDTVGFLGVVMLRRLVTFAHVADMDSIAGGWGGARLLACSKLVCSLWGGGLVYGWCIASGAHGTVWLDLGGAS